MSSEKRDEQSLKGQVAVVTGSTQGIGAGIALTLAQHGAQIVVHGLEKQRAGGEKIVKSIGEAGSRAILITGDLRDEAHCRGVIQKAIAELGRVDILVNNAAVVHRSNLENTTTELWDEVFAVNIRAPFLLCQEAVKDMKSRRQGCIVNIGSGNGYCGMKRLLPYSTSKGAMITFTKNLSNYLTQYRIRVNQVNPGWTVTEGEQIAMGVIDGKGESWVAAADKTRPSGRMLIPSDIAKAVLFFATNEMVSGAVLDHEQFPFGAPVESII